MSDIINMVFVEEKMKFGQETKCSTIINQYVIIWSTRKHLLTGQQMCLLSDRTSDADHYRKMFAHLVSRREQLKEGCVMGNSAQVLKL